jgi:VWFA-related protein
MCFHRFSIVALLLFAFTFSSAQELSSIAPAQDLAAAAIPAPPALTIFKHVDEVNLVLSATNHHGRFVRDLNASDLVISDNGEPPAKITYFQTQTDLPLQVALVIDTSDSINYRFDFELRAARSFFKQVLRPGYDSALIVGFNQQATLVQPLTADLSRLDHGLKSLKAHGETALFDALALASDQLRPTGADPGPVRRVIILVTDGEDNSSRITQAEAVDRALRSESVIYVVNVKQYRVTEEDIQGDRIIQELATSTGGAVLQSADKEDIVTSFRKIQEELRSQYALGYRPRNLIQNYLFRPIRIFGPRGIRIHCREGYYPR